MVAISSFVVIVVVVIVWNRSGGSTIELKLLHELFYLTQKTLGRTCDFLLFFSSKLKGGSEFNSASTLPIWNGVRFRVGIRVRAIFRVRDINRVRTKVKRDFDCT